MMIKHSSYSGGEGGYLLLSLVYSEVSHCCKQTLTLDFLLIFVIVMRFSIRVANNLKYNQFWIKLKKTIGIESKIEI